MIIDLSIFMIIKPTDLYNLCTTLNITPITQVDGEFLETLIIANIFAYFIIILFLWGCFKVLTIFFGKGARGRICQ